MPSFDLDGGSDESAGNVIAVFAHRFGDNAPSHQLTKDHTTRAEPGECFETCGHREPNNQNNGGNVRSAEPRDTRANGKP